MNNELSFFTRFCIWKIRNAINIHVIILNHLASLGNQILFKSQDIKADKHLIEQVLINLILNAVQAFPLDRNNKSILLSASQSLEGRTEITVVDNGVGIPEEIKEQIFVPFFTTKKEGNGIGLSLCKQIMTLHKGHIRIQSTKDKGTVVKLLFTP